MADHISDKQLLEAAVSWLRELQKETEKLYRENHWYESFSLLGARKYLEAYDLHNKIKGA